MLPPLWDERSTTSSGFFFRIIPKGKKLKNGKIVLRNGPTNCAACISPSKCLATTSRYTIADNRFVVAGFLCERCVSYPEAILHPIDDVGGKFLVWVCDSRDFFHTCCFSYIGEAILVHSNGRGSINVSLLHLSQQSKLSKKMIFTIVSDICLPIHICHGPFAPYIQIR